MKRVLCEGCCEGWAGEFPVDDASDAWIGINICDHGILRVKVAGTKGETVALDRRIE